MTVARFRFAPSPTGLLHVGNARIALVNWLFARKLAGIFLLRLDDTDAERSETRFATAIEEDLRWLGLDWDEFVRQSDRAARYAAAMRTLIAAGRLYPCYETPDELEIRRRVALKAGRPPIYDRAALALTDADRAALEARGRRAHWRFRLDAGEIAWDDLVRGRVSFEGANLSDPVLVREDGRPLYTFSSVVDDLDLSVTHVVRGEDHVANTAAQLQVYEALGGDRSAVAFAHLSLLADTAGKGLSKREGAASLADLRVQGNEPMAVNSLLARLGTSEPVEPFLTLDDLVADFDIARFGRATPRFDPGELRALNARLLHMTPYEAVAGRLGALGIEGDARAFWEAVRPNLARLEDALDWWRIVRGPVAPTVDDPDFLAEAARLLPAEPWNGDTWADWTGALRGATGRKGRALFHPLRRALTGRDDGPELKLLLPLVGRARAEARLRGETA